MSGVITIKRGDTLAFTGQYKQKTGDPMDLTGHTLTVNVLNANDKPVFSIVDNDAYRSVVITNAIDGRFTVVVKDTNILREEDYWLDIKATSPNGHTNTSKAVKLRVKNKLV